jgi:hypothetical protein
VLCTCHSPGIIGSFTLGLRGSYVSSARSSGPVRPLSRIAKTYRIVVIMPHQKESISPLQKITENNPGTKETMPRVLGNRFIFGGMSRVVAACGGAEAGRFGVDVRLVGTPSHTRAGVGESPTERPPAMPACSRTRTSSFAARRAPAASCAATICSRREPRATATFEAIPGCRRPASRARD